MRFVVFVLLLTTSACMPPSGGGDGDRDAAAPDLGPVADAAPDPDLAVEPDAAPDAAVDPDAAVEPDAAAPDAALPPALMLRTQWGGVDTLEVYTEDIYAIWWDPRFDHAADAVAIAEQLIEIRRTCLDDLGMADPPNPPAGYYYNVYIHHGPDDVFPEGWGNAQGTDMFGMPFLTLPVGAHRDRGNIYHEGFHIFQYSATSAGFAYRGDSQWYVEASAQWFRAVNLPDDEFTFSQAHTITANPHLALWHSFGNEAPGDPTDFQFRVRQYGMHTWLYFMTAVGGVDPAVVSDGFYAGTNLSPQAYHVAMVGLPALRRIFGDWAARNTRGLDYLTPLQVERARIQSGVVGDPENRAPFAIEVGPDGTAGWVSPPERLAPRPWSYNVVRFEGTPGARYRVEFEADAMGAEGGRSWFEARWVTMGDDGPAHVDFALDDAIAGDAEVEAEAGWAALVVASVPALYGGNQTFGYRVRITMVE